MLNSSADGKSILKYYNSSQQSRLDKNTRSLLTRIIIGSEIDKAFREIDLEIQPHLMQKFSIDSSKLKKLSKRIQKLFPNEPRSLYYSPYDKKYPEKKVTGSILEHYDYKKKVYRRKAILAQSLRTRKDPVVDYLEIDEDEIPKLEWLTNHLDPVDDVLNNWKSTYASRYELLLSGTEIHEYFNKFPCLITNQAINLV